MHGEIKFIFYKVKEDMKRIFPLVSTDLRYLLQIFFRKGRNPLLQKNLQNLAHIRSTKEKNRSQHGVKRKFLFPFPIFLSLGLILFLCLWLYWLLFSFHEEDRLEYKSLLDRANAAETKTSNTLYSAEQQHRQARKDLFFMKNGERLQMTVFSEDTRLILDKQEGHSDIVEHMTGVHCCMQEELFYLTSDGKEVMKSNPATFILRNGEAIDSNQKKLVPMQKIRYLDAKKAIYYYQTDLFLAENVKISEYVVDGHYLLENPPKKEPTITGTASAVEFSIAKDNIQFIAHHFKAIIKELKQ